MKSFKITQTANTPLTNASALDGIIIKTPSNAQEAFRQYAIMALAEYEEMYDVPNVVQEHVMPYVDVDGDDKCSFTDAPEKCIFFGSHPDSLCTTQCELIEGGV